MLGLFRKKEELVFSPCNGKIIPIEKIEDDVFSKKMMGDGIGIIPSDSQIVSPINGEVVQIFETKHAILLKSKEETLILIHIGLDTVGLDGKPFKVNIECGSNVSKGQQIMDVDFDMIREAKLDTTVIVILMDEENKKTIIEKAYGLDVSNDKYILKIKNK